MTTIDPSRWSELSPLLDKVLDLDGQERAAWLEALRGSRPEVTVELESLLAQLRSLDATGFLQGDLEAFMSRALASWRGT
jgi:hypothetical protein